MFWDQAEHCALLDEMSVSALDVSPNKRRILLMFISTVLDVIPTGLRIGLETAAKRT